MELRTYDKSKDTMTKNKAIRLFWEERGIVMNGNVTYSSRNHFPQDYWANPNFRLLDADWYLILKDYMKQKLYLFFIPARSIQKNQLLARSDHPNLISLNIQYNNPKFCDGTSGFCFDRFLVDELEYQ